MGGAIGFAPMLTPNNNRLRIMFHCNLRRRHLSLFGKAQLELLSMDRLGVRGLWAYRVVRDVRFRSAEQGYVASRAGWRLPLEALLTSASPAECQAVDSALPQDRLSAFSTSWKMFSYLRYFGQHARSDVDHPRMLGTDRRRTALKSAAYAETRSGHRPRRPLQIVSDNGTEVTSTAVIQLFQPNQVE